ncbi:MAG: hypothetical protein EZS28_034458, partial [Streblomastix strix]
MLSSKELKAILRPVFEADNEKYYPMMSGLKKLGYLRVQCPKCHHYYWRLTPERETCGDSGCEGKYHFVGSGC